MSKKVVLLPIVVAVGAAFLAPVASAEGVDFHGYFRVQAGGTSEGGNLQCFQGPFPIRAKYRLGNECDNYAEPSIGLPFGDTNGVWGKYKLTVAMQSKGTQDAESTAPDANGVSKFNFLSRENYFQAGGFFGKGAFENSTLWVGQRFFNRHDIHMNDYYYWSNSGPGAGIEEISAGPAKLAVSYFQNGGNGNAANDIVGKRMTLRFYDVNVPGGKLEGEAVYLFGSSATNTAPKGHGEMLFLEHTQDGLLGGFNKVAFVYGKDQGSGFEWLPTYQAGGEQKGTSWRVHDHLYFDFKGTPWTGTATASYGRWKPEGSAGFTWISAGIRPQYNFTNTVSVAVEAGYDQGKDDAGVKSKVAKLTVAPQLALSRGVWARPVLRAFVTYAKWNAPAAGANGLGIANGVFGTKTNGMTFGVQAEAWW